MKTSSRSGHRLRVLLPLIMTSVQLGLLAASLIIPREPWVLAAPPEPKAISQSDCPSEDCVTFSPGPSEPKAGRILKMAMVVNLPAVFLGAFLAIATALIHIPHPPGEPTLLGFSLVFVPLIWYRVGKWADDSASGGIVRESTQLSLTALWRILARVIVWFLFALMLLSLLVEYHREGETARFLIVISILWTGAYLAGGFLGDRRRAARLRAP